MRLRFADAALRRLYEDGSAIAGIDADVVEYFLDALAVLRAARGIDELSGLRAFESVPVDRKHSERRAMSLSGSWRMIFSVVGENTEEAAVTIESLRRAQSTARRSR